MVVDSVSVIVSVKNLYNVNNNMCKGKKKKKLKGYLMRQRNIQELSRVHCRVYRNTTDRMCK